MGDMLDLFGSVLGKLWTGHQLWSNIVLQAFRTFQINFKDVLFKLKSGVG